MKHITLATLLLLGGCYSQQEAALGERVQTDIRRHGYNAEYVSEAYPALYAEVRDTQAYLMDTATHGTPGPAPYAYPVTGGIEDLVLRERVRLALRRSSQWTPGWVGRFVREEE